MLSVPPLDSRFRGGDDVGIGADGIAGRRGPIDHAHAGRFANRPLQVHRHGVSWEAGLYYLRRPVPALIVAGDKPPALHFSLMTRDET